MRRTVAALAVALAALVGPAGPAPARAADAVTWGTPTLTATFLQGLGLREPATLPSGVASLEVRVRYGDDPIVDVQPLDVPAAGARTLTYALPTPSGSLMPNTVVRMRFRVVLADGSVSDGPEATVTYADTRLAWKTVSGPIVRLHWTEGDAAFGARALKIAETAIADTSALLGVTETEPIDFFVYADRQQFYDVLGPSSRENVGGVAFPSIRTMFANIAPDQLDASWVGIVIPHELTHLVFQTAVDNPYHQPAHWLNEGLADYLAQGYDAEYRGMVADAIKAGSLIPLHALAGQFPTTPERFALGYAESVSAIDHLVSKYGKSALVALIRSYADGLTDDEAFTKALGVDVAGFEAGWYAALGTTAPVARGPVDAPLGPLPSDWTGPTRTPAPAPSVPPGGGGDTADGLGLVAPAALGLLVGGILGVVLLVARSRRPRNPWA